MKKRGKSRIIKSRTNPHQPRSSRRWATYKFFSRQSHPSRSTPRAQCNAPHRQIENVHSAEFGNNSRHFLINHIDRKCSCDNNCSLCSDGSIATQCRPYSGKSSPTSFFHQEDKEPLRRKEGSILGDIGWLREHGPLYFEKRTELKQFIPAKEPVVFIIFEP